MQIRYRVVDVFTLEPLQGNALAVFPDAAALDTGTMQRIAAEMNLAESAFIVPPTREGCAAGVRIFTPRHEMPFAGHPTVGTSFVLLDEGIVAPGVEEFLLDEKIGAVAVRVEAGARPRIWLRTPPIERGPAYDRALCAEALGLRQEDLLEPAPRLVSAGNPTLFIPLRNADAVDRAWADLSGTKRLRGDGAPFLVFVFTPTAGGAYSRMFAPDFGVPEDPATGSATGPLAVYMMDHGLVPREPGTRFISEQGTKMGRRSLLHVHVRDAETIDVGGYVTPLATALMTLDAC